MTEKENILDQKRLSFAAGITVTLIVTTFSLSLPFNFGKRSALVSLQFKRSLESIFASDFERPNVVGQCRGLFLLLLNSECAFPMFIEPNVHENSGDP